MEGVNGWLRDYKGDPKELPAEYREFPGTP